MWRRPPPLLCGSWASMITHLINGESKHIGSRFPKYSSLASAAARPQIASSSEDEQKRTAASFSTSSEVRLESVHSDPAVEILNDLRREPNRAQGLEEDAATCAEIVRVLCGSDVEKKLISLISEIISSGNDSDCVVLAMFDFLSVVQNCGNLVSVAFDTVIREYTHLEMPDRAARIFFQLCARGYVPCINTCNFLMNLLVRSDDPKSVDDVYSQIKRSEVIPNLDTFRIMTKALFIPGKLYELHHDVSEEMRRIGIDPDSSIVSERVRGLCARGGLYCGYMLLKSAVRTFGISMTAIDYNLVISGFCRMEKLCVAEEVLGEMVKQGVPPNVNTYLSLIRGYCSSRNISRVLSLRDEMALRGIGTNCVIESSILHCLSELGRNAEVLELFEKYKNSGQIVDKVLYNIAMDAQCKLGKMEEAAETFQEMKGCGLVPDKVHYTTLIHGYCRQGEIDNAWKTFSCMADVGLKPDVVTYNILASVFAKTGFIEETHGHLYHMLDHGVEPNFGTNVTVIRGFCRGGNLEELEHLSDSLQQMED